jgi:hypothetical protein
MRARRRAIIQEIVGAALAALAELWVAIFRACGKTRRPASPPVFPN